MAVVCPVLDNQYFDPNGNPLAGGKLFFYVGGSFSTEKTTYENAAATIPNPNPIVLDSSGYLTTPVFLSTGLYNIALTMPDGTTVLNTWVNIEGGVCDCSQYFFGEVWCTQNQAQFYYDTQLDVSGNMYCVGRAYPGGPNGYGVVTKLDNTGSILWNKIYSDSPGSPLGAIFFRSRIDSDNNLIVIGGIVDQYNNYNVIVAKIAGTTGALIWQKVINNVPGQIDMVYPPPGLCLDNDDNVYVGYTDQYGSFQSIIVKFDKDGAVVWKVNVINMPNSRIQALSYDNGDNTLTFAANYFGQPFGRINAVDGTYIRAADYALVQDARMFAITTDDAGHTYLLMSAPSQNEIYTATICKLDINYDIVWQRQYECIESINVDDTLWNIKLVDDKIFFQFSRNGPETGGLYGSVVCCANQSDGSLVYSTFIYSTQTDFITPGFDVRDGVVTVVGRASRVNPTFTGYISRMPANTNGIGTYGWWTYKSEPITVQTPTYIVQPNALGTFPSTASVTAGNMVAINMRVTSQINELVI